MLRPTYVDDAAIFESFPQSPAALARRDERWARGDMLNLLRFPSLVGSDQVQSKFLACTTIGQQVLGWLGGFLGFPLIIVSLWRPTAAGQLSLMAMFLFPGIIRLVWRAVVNAPSVGIGQTLRLFIVGCISLFIATAIRVWRAPRTFLVIGGAWGRAIKAWVSKKGGLRWSPASKAMRAKHAGLSWAASAIFSLSAASLFLLPPSSHSWVTLLVVSAWLLLPVEHFLLIKKDDFHKRTV